MHGIHAAAQRLHAHRAALAGPAMVGAGQANRGIERCGPGVECFGDACGRVQQGPLRGTALDGNDDGTLLLG